MLIVDALNHPDVLLTPVVVLLITFLVAASELIDAVYMTHCGNLA